MGLRAYIVGHLSRSLNSPSRLTDKNGERVGHIQIGEYGEKIAKAHLISKGRKVLYQNFRGPKGGEIDIVTRDGDTLSFVEVKTRKKSPNRRPLEAVDKKKQELIKRGARAWLSLLKETDFVWRFDVVEVELTEGEKPEVTVINGAFD